MPTRADFYLGKGRDSQWIGSICFDGYPEGNPNTLAGITTQEQYLEAVSTILDDEDNGTKPEEGYPFPWADKPWITDYSYTFDEGKTWVSCQRQWVEFSPELLQRLKEDEDWELPEGNDEFPDLSHLKNVPIGGKSGFIVITPNGVF